MEIWLIDANHYYRETHQDIIELKKSFYKLKKLIRIRKLGIHPLPKEKTYSIGLLRLASIFSYNNMEIKMLDLYEDIDMLLNNSVPNIVVFSAVCPTIPLCHMIMKKLKLYSNRIKVVIGGAHINVAHDQTVIKYPGFDAYINAYDMQAAAAILEKDKTDLFIPDKYVNYSLLPEPLENYLINTFTTMGCVNNCLYCQDKHIPFFQRNLEGDIREFVDLLPSKTTIHFFDSTLGYDRQGLRKVCMDLSKINHDFILSCELRAEQVDLDTIKLLKTAGFKEVRIGIESANPKVHSMNRRKTGVDVIVDKLKMIKEYSDIYISTYFLAGLSGSSLSGNLLTYELIERLILSGYVDEVKNGVYVPYPIDGVNYHAQGINITNHNWSDYDRQSYPVFALEGMSSDQIWHDFIRTTDIVVSSMSKREGISLLDDLDDDLYPEYNCLNYNIK